MDVFTYKVNRTPFTPPQIVVSYNDGQGNHKFVTPVKLKSLSDSLTSYRSAMRQDPTLKIIGAQPFTATGDNTTFFFFNNPSKVSIRDAILLVGFATPEGDNVAEKVVRTTLLPGPNTIPVTWRTSEFSPAYQSGKDYKMVGFITDHSNVVIDTDLRYLSSLRRDPHPQLVMSESAWNFGTVTQGEVIRKTFSYANTGTSILDTYLDKPAGVTVRNGPPHKLEPGDTATFTVVMDTQILPAGAYQRALTLRTSDPRNSSRSIPITGTISPPTGGAASSPIEGRPWDRYVWVPGSHSQGDKVDFAHGIVTDAAEIEPLYVYDAARQTLRGAGTSLPDHVPSSVFGDGRDGDLKVASGQTHYVDSVRTRVSTLAAAGQRTISVASASGLAQGDNVLIAQMRGSQAGQYEFGTIESLGSGQITLQRALQKSYQAGPGPCGGGFHAQFFNNRDLAGSPVLERCDSRTDFNWGGGSPDPRVQVDNFSARWVAQRIFPIDGHYTFNVSVDDGVRIYVDDVLILNEWRPAPYNQYSVTRHIAAGIHTIRIEYYEEGGAAAIRLSAPGTNNTAQVFRVPQYRNVTIEDGGMLTAHSWDGGTGGLAAFRVFNQLLVQPGGKLAMMGKGFSGGYGKATGSGRPGDQGESSLSPGSEANAANGGGGGGSTAATVDSQGNYFLESSGGGGGGFGAAGRPGGNYGPSLVGPGGEAYGNDNSATLHLG
ncbi:MAG: PA14 domain-containing protein, partial [Chloroflexota bacterium]|nr:PA14 domain-containing protein [Chloroflexota bacterium]